eukprot:GILJ01005436.1.p1 GENE.GILJ01005436.1~~GILJ01005436.1.p1  ORF type:complete len:587 (-),score=81.48 GILJ01005436.1:193-1953(-)
MLTRGWSQLSTHENDGTEAHECLLRRSLPIEFSSNRIKQLFEKSARKRGFDIVYMGHSGILSIRRPSIFSFWRLSESFSRLRHLCAPAHLQQNEASKNTKTVVLRMLWRAMPADKSISVVVDGLSLPERTRAIAVVQDFAAALAKESVVWEMKNGQSGKDDSVFCGECKNGHEGVAGNPPATASGTVLSPPSRAVTMPNTRDEAYENARAMEREKEAVKAENLRMKMAQEKQKVRERERKNNARSNSAGSIPIGGVGSFRGGKSALGPPVFGEEAERRRQQEQEEEAENGSNSNRQSKMEASTYYHIHRILCSDSYSLGKMIAEFITQFEFKYGEPAQAYSLLPKPTHECSEMIETAVNVLTSQYNFGREHAELLPLVRPAVERFFFNKLYETISPLYNRLYETDNRRFAEKAKRLEALSASALFSSLELKRRYWLVPENEPNDAMPESTAGSIPELHFKSQSAVPYSEAIRSLQRLEHLYTPREKLDCIVQTFSLMRACVVDFWKGKEELVAMDDELPIFIYIMIRAQLEYPFSEHAMLIDSLPPAVRMESEGKDLVTFESAAKYINFEWPHSDFTTPVVTANIL